MIHKLYPVKPNKRKTNMKEKDGKSNWKREADDTALKADNTALIFF